MYAFTGFKMGLGLTCDPGYHSYTPDGVNFICQPDVSTVAAQYSNQVIQAEAAALPASPIGQFEAQYGGLPNAVQEQVINCQEFIGANAITGQPIPSYCNALVEMSKPYVPNVNPIPISTPTPKSDVAAAPSAQRQVTTPSGGGGQVTNATPAPSPSTSTGAPTSPSLMDTIASWFGNPTVSGTNVNAPIGTSNAPSSSDANAVSTAPSSFSAWVGGLTGTEIAVGVGVVALLGYFMMKQGGPTFVGR